ncbi:MAG TPA: YihY/virulence factor BrkB family protein [Acidimicrobiia bacterium]|nr:YihY/virulence factor BrkB family protein [Acidimicrobiia bacterium]
MLERILRPLTRRYRWAAVGLEVQKRFSELHGGMLARGVTLAAFLSLFPLLLLVIAVTGFFSQHNSHLAADLISTFGLTGKARQTFTDALAVAQRSRQAASVVGLVGVLWSGLAVVGAMEFALDSVWRVSGRGLKDRLWGLAWLGGAGLILIGSFAVTGVVGYLPAPAAVLAAPLSIALGLAIDVCLWLWTFTVLTNCEVGWRTMLPGAVLGATGLEVLKALGAIWLPRTVASSSALYGSIGVVFAVLAWLLLFGQLVVYAAVLNRVLYERRQSAAPANREVTSIRPAV